VTIEEGSESVMWNCFRAKCGWQGRVDTRGGTSKAYRQYKNDSGSGTPGGGSSRVATHWPLAGPRLQEEDSFGGRQQAAPGLLAGWLDVGLCQRLLTAGDPHGQVCNKRPADTGA
jgi:hypothetical protein